MDGCGGLLTTIGVDFAALVNQIGYALRTKILILSY